MGGILGARLAHAGMLDRAVLGQALALASLERVHPIEALVRCGVEEEWLAQHAAAMSGLARASADALARPSDEWTKRLPVGFLRRCLVAPLAIEGAALIVAVVDPFDRHGIDEAHRLLRRPIRAVVATVGEVRATLERMLGGLATPTPRAAFTLAGRAAHGERLHGNVRPASSQRKSGEFPLPSGSFDVGASQEWALDPPAATEVEPAAALERWDVGPTARAPRLLSPAVAATQGAGNARRRFERDGRPLPAPQEDVGAALAAIRASASREAVLGSMLTACLLHARQAFFFRLRDGRLEGVDSAGSTIGAVAVRRIVLPLSVGSTMHRVLVEGQPHFGALLAGATDQVLRAAIGSRGGRVSMHGLWIDGRPIALLVADDVRSGELGHERIGALAHAASIALRRLLTDRTG